MSGDVLLTSHQQWLYARETTTIHDVGSVAFPVILDLPLVLPVHVDSYANLPKKSYCKTLENFAQISSPTGHQLHRAFPGC